MTTRTLIYPSRLDNGWALEVAGALSPSGQAQTSKYISPSRPNPISKKISVHFPGALKSKFTSKMSFEDPSSHPAIPTYRVMDSDGVIVDESRGPPDVPSDEILSWYKTMLTGNPSPA